MKIEINQFGQYNGQRVDLISLSNRHGIKISVTNYGCIVTSLETPDRRGNIADIVLGYDTLDKYLQGHPFFGAIAGRFANRINGGIFSLNGQTYQLEKNELTTQQHLHGGQQGFDKYRWEYDIEPHNDLIAVHFHRVSPDGESGYPGNLNVTHSIILDEQNQVHFNFTAITDKTTVINLTNHSYYNLSGHNQGLILNHQLTLFSDFYTPVNEQMIPTGEILSVQNSGLDFRTSTRLKDNMQKLTNQSIDNNFILRGERVAGEYNKAAELYDPDSGRMMTVITTQPALQVYNASKLSNKNWFGKNHHKYESFAGICLETQHYPDSPNHSHFPSTKLEPGQIYNQKTIHQFSICK